MTTQMTNQTNIINTSMAAQQLLITTKWTVRPSLLPLR